MVDNVVHYAYAELGEMLIEQQYGPPGVVEATQIEDGADQIVCLLAYLCSMVSDLHASFFENRESES